MFIKKHVVIDICMPNTSIVKASFPFETESVSAKEMNINQKLHSGDHLLAGFGLQMCFIWSKLKMLTTQSLFFKLFLVS